MINNRSHRILLAPYPLNLQIVKPGLNPENDIFKGLYTAMK
jgi:hypothetical protein